MNAFPECIIDVIEPRLREYLDGYTMIRRPLRLTDPARSMGFFFDTWQPDLTSWETGQVEQTINRYLFRIQLMVKHLNEVEGRNEYALKSKVVRTVLYRDPGIRLGLPELQETALGSIERFQRFGIAGQKFLSNEISGENVFISTSTCWVETETSLT